MSIINIELPPRDWKVFRIQGIEGRIIKHNGHFKIEVEVMELPGNFHYYDFNCIIELNESMIGKTVVGDIGGPNGFNILILCLVDNVKID